MPCGVVYMLAYPAMRTPLVRLYFRIGTCFVFRRGVGKKLKKGILFSLEREKVVLSHLPLPSFVSIILLCSVWLCFACLCVSPRSSLHLCAVSVEAIFHALLCGGFRGVGGRNRASSCITKGRDEQGIIFVGINQGLQLCLRRV